MIAHLERISPDVVHLHNLHGHDCHLEELFQYLRKRGMKLYWTFHDCWAFTAYCPYYDMANCSQWKNGCSNCPQRARFSWFIDRSRELFRRKKELLSGLDLTIVAPSHWMADQIRQSFLQEYEVKVIHNGIDLTTFRPQKSGFRTKYGLEEKFVLLGVAYDWGARKGLDVFIELAKRLDDRFRVVMVGTNRQIDKYLPGKIISIHTTQDQAELAQIYSAADVFVNPTREDNYPTVNLEALACGTPVVTFRTGGSPEMLSDQTGGVVERDDIDALEKEIIRICVNRPFLREQCVEKAAEFDEAKYFESYLALYKNREIGAF